MEGEKRAQAQRELMLAVGARSVARVREALAAGADANAADEYGDRWTVLHWAAQMAQPGAAEEMVGILLSASADPNATGRDGRRPLHQTALNGTMGSARALIEAGALVWARDREGYTAADLARFAAFAQPGRDLKMAEYLESAGALREAAEIDQALPASCGKRAAPRV